VAVCLLCGGGAAAIASLTASTDKTQAPPTPAIARPRAEVQAIPPAAAASFAVLRRPRRTADRFAPLSAGAGPTGSNPALARSVLEPIHGLSAGRVSVVPGNGTICLRIPLVGQAGSAWDCVPTAVAARGDLVASYSSAVDPARPALIYGLAPDGVRRVSITGADGSVHVITVHSNVYEAQLTGPQVLAMTLASGRVARYRIPGPASSQR
jgi:hypothetical protein